MKKYLLLGVLVCLSSMALQGQDQPPSSPATPVGPDHFTLRPNSRDYAIVRKGNNHQRIIQLRTQAMIRNRQAMLNRKMAMERKRTSMQRQMIRQQQIRQRMIRQHGMHH
jgi:hypothetical protein